MANTTIPKQKHRFEATLIGGKSCLEMHRQKDNAQFYGERCREKAA